MNGSRVILVTFVSVALFVTALEAAYGTYKAARRALWGHHEIFDRADHPYWKRQWYAGWAERVSRLTQTSTYDPYRGWRLRPTISPGLQIDSAGRRRTVQPASRVAAPRRVFMLGGSVMWGYSARDSFTIPSLVAARLAQRGLRDVEVVNLASIGYNITQGANTLILELRRGNVASVVVSLDGINEAGVVFEGGKPGEVYDQAQAEQRFDRTSPWRDVARLGEHLRGTNRFAWLITRKLMPPSQPPPPGPDIVCGDVAAYYARIARVMDAVAREYGFPILFLWTPSLARSRKPRTSWESFMASFNPGMQALTTRCGAVADSLMAPRLGTSFFPLDSLFDRDTASVFLDHYGHVTEEANGVIADRIADLLVPLLGPTGPS